MFISKCIYFFQYYVSKCYLIYQARFIDFLIPNKINSIFYEKQYMYIYNQYFVQSLKKSIDINYNIMFDMLNITIAIHNRRSSFIYFCFNIIIIDGDYARLVFIG